MTQPLYVVAGQSNAVRIERANGIEEALEIRDSDAGVLHVSQGGTGLAPSAQRADWFPFEDDNPQTGELYEELVDSINELLATGEYHLAGIFWLQDGADASANDAPLYEERLQGLVDGLVSEFGADFQFTIVETSEVTPGFQEALETGVYSDPRFEFAETIRDAQLAVAEANENVNIINTVEVWTAAGLPEVTADGDLIFGDNVFSDAVHFNGAASDALAEAFIAQFDETETSVNADGIEIVRHYSEGSLFKIERSDLEDARSFETRTEYYQDGEITGFSTLRDDGVIHDGQIIDSAEFGTVFEHIFTDIDDVAPWESRVVTTTLDGDILADVTIPDDQTGMMSMIDILS